MAPESRLRQRQRGLPKQRPLPPLLPDQNHLFSPQHPGACLSPPHRQTKLWKNAMEESACLGTETWRESWPSSRAGPGPLAGAAAGHGERGPAREPRERKGVHGGRPGPRRRVTQNLLPHGVLAIALSALSVSSLLRRLLPF